MKRLTFLIIFSQIFILGLFAENITVSTVQDLMDIQQKVSEGTDFSGSTIRLANDITLEDIEFEGVETVHSIEAALNLVADDEEAFVMGGATMYRLFLPHADKLYLTRIVSEFTADVWFPEIDENEWKVVESEFVPKDEKNVYDLYFQTLLRQK